MAFTSVIVVAILIIILIGSVLCGCVSQQAEFFATNSNINYVDSKTFTDMIILSPFFRNLTPIDLYARGRASSQEEYAQRYMESEMKFSDDEKDILDKCISRASDLLRDFPKLRLAPWNFAKVKASIENGYPHTIGNAIVLNERVLRYPINELTKTLIHEKIHVAQRTYPIDFLQLYESIGFEKTSVASRHILARANPDIDNFLYIYKSTDQVPMQLYTSKYPSSIADSMAMVVLSNGDSVEATTSTFGLPEDIHCQLEHPNEIVACLMAEMITNPDLSYIQKNVSLSTIWKWMIQNWK